jgi:hypothetical protein
MEAFFKALLESGNGISVVTVVLIGATAFIWAIETERLFTGSRGREMKKTIETQAEALDLARTELHKTERDFDRISILYEIARNGKGVEGWPSTTSKEPK